MGMDLQGRLALFEANPVGLGCWALGGKHWGGQSDRQSFATMEEAFRQGIRHFDTAQGYGVSEKLVGEFLKDRREEVFLASKVFPKGGPETIRENLLRSLEKLQSGFLDLYYLHWPISTETLEKQMESIDAVKSEGLTKAVGVSNYSVQQLERVQGVAKVDFVQIGYHALWRRDESDVIPYCQENGIRVVAYSPLGQGILTGKFPLNPVFAKGDYRAKTVHFREDIWPMVHSSVEKLKFLAQKAECPLSQLAIKWCLSMPGISGVVVGARTPQQALQNAQSMQADARPEILEEISVIGEQLMPELPEEENIFGVSFN